MPQGNYGQDSAPLLRAIEQALRTHAIRPSVFGRAYMGDPRFVFDLRKGRSVKPQTIARVQSSLRALETGNA